ncbi:MAG TPA: ABC transporter permease [Candidatus Acidoferrales bacterium]|nr:ABC transporter permease [Candidatus Acidoferrales bacterium]
MSLRNVGIVYRKELVDSLRDRRTLISMIVVPLLVMPLLTIGMGVLSIALVGIAMREVPRVMVLGGEDSPGVLAELNKLSDLEIVPAKPDYAEEISSKRIRAAVEIPAGFEAKLAAGESSTVKIYMYQGELKSGFGADRLQRFFSKLRDRAVREHLQARHLPENLARPFDILETNVASAEKVGGTVLGGLVPYFVILLCLTGAMYPAMDLTAGEKERGTIETLLCSPVSRTHLVIGKFLMVLTASIATAILAITSMAVSFGTGKQMLLSITKGAADPSLQITVTPKGVVSIFFVVFPLAVFFSAALLALSLVAKSFKEAQSYISPLMILVVMPAIASLLPGVELTPALAFIPVLNTSLVSKEIISGTFHWNLIGLIFLSSSIYAGIAIAIAVKLFQREDVLFRT